MAVNFGIFLVTTLRIFMLPGRNQSDAYSIYHTIPTYTCYLLLPDLFDALMSSDINIIELLAYNCHFNNTPLGLNRKFMNMYNCNKCYKVEEAHGVLLLLLVNVRCKNWSVPQFQKDEIECMIYDVCVNWSRCFMLVCILKSEYLLSHARLSCMNDLLLWY